MLRVTMLLPALVALLGLIPQLLVQQCNGQPLQGVVG
jgi:hypothetical protein